MLIFLLYLDNLSQLPTPMMKWHLSVDNYAVLFSIWPTHNSSLSVSKHVFNLHLNKQLYCKLIKYWSLKRHLLRFRMNIRDKQRHKVKLPQQSMHNYFLNVWMTFHICLKILFGYLIRHVILIELFCFLLSLVHEKLRVDRHGIFYCTSLYC